MWERAGRGTIQSHYYWEAASRPPLTHTHTMYTNTTTTTTTTNRTLTTTQHGVIR